MSSSCHLSDIFVRIGLSLVIWLLFLWGWVARGFSMRRVEEVGIWLFFGGGLSGSWMIHG